MRATGYTLIGLNVAMVVVAIVLAVQAPDQRLVASLVMSASFMNVIAIALGLWWTR